MRRVINGKTIQEDRVKINLTHPIYMYLKARHDRQIRVMKARLKLVGIRPNGL